jgi:hypothetical protein
MCRDDGSACIVEDRLATFVENANVVVPIVLSSSCIGVSCVAGTTCSEHVCVPVPGATPQLDAGATGHDASVTDAGPIALDASKADAAPPTDAASPRDASAPKEASAPPPTCPQLSGTTACCGEIACVGPASLCTTSAQCNKCETKCGTDPQKVRCCVSATRVEKDGSPKTDCKRANETCPE